MENEKFDRTVFSIQSFLEIDFNTWERQLREHHFECMKGAASISQIKAWKDCFNILRRELAQLPLSKEIVTNVFVVFEYELPRENGRRPDVLILSGQNLIVLEFKGYAQGNNAHIDQVKHYARDFKSYHSQSHDLNVIPVLVLTAAHNLEHLKDGVIVISAEKLGAISLPFVLDKYNDIQTWFNSEYAPLPSIIQSAQLLFKEKHFPQIKKAISAGIPDILKKLTQITERSQNEQSHHLALITGVPGAGKTLVGLQFVFETYVQNRDQKAVFLSGNDPLVDVLQFSLSNRNFVQSVHGFLKQYANLKQIPSENVIIYDEAQRAWDADKVSDSNRNSENAEPTDFINIGSKKPYCLLIGLIGEGQEIHIGEEAGIKLWSEAICQSNKKWVIHCPGKLKDSFNNVDIDVVDKFNLNTSLRTHQALSLQSWVEYLLENQISKAKEVATKLFSENYPIYLTRNLEVAKTYLQNRYSEEPGKTFGLISSSKSKILPKYGIMNDYLTTRKLKEHEYYADEKDPSYCRNLNNVVTEFACQGLELDMPILAWEIDWVYENGWQNVFPNKKAKNSDQLRKNSYRVLLTRGRDGLIIFVPNDNKLDSTYEILVAAGCKILS